MSDSREKQSNSSYWSLVIEKKIFVESFFCLSIVSSPHLSRILTRNALSFNFANFRNPGVVLLLPAKIYTLFISNWLVISWHQTVTSTTFVVSF